MVGVYRARIDVDPAHAALVRAADAGAAADGRLHGDDSTGTMVTQTLPQRAAVQAAYRCALTWSPDAGGPVVPIGTLQLNLPGLLRAGFVSREPGGGVRLTLYHHRGTLVIATGLTDRMLRVASLSW